MIFAASTDHIYLDAGHTLDFANKAFELLDHIGWEHASQTLTSLVHGMARARRSQELSAWRHPIDLASLVWQAREELAGALRTGLRNAAGWEDADGLAREMLGETPSDILDAIKEAIRSGATAEQLGSAVAYAAFLRMAHFHVSNEFGDWDTVHNTLTAANALHRALCERAPSVELLRGVFDVAMSIYLDRFLNMPAQRIPETGQRAAGRCRAAGAARRLDERASAGGGGIASRVSPPDGRRRPGRADSGPGTRHACRGRGFPLIPNRGCRIGTIPGAMGNRIWTACADRHGALPGGARANFAGRGPDLPDRVEIASGRRALSGIAYRIVATSTPMYNRAQHST